MREAIPDRDRWLALAILAGVLALAYLVLVHPWWTAPMLEAGERIESLQERDLRVRMELAQAPQVQARLEEVRAVAARVPGFMDERSAELATAALSARLETAVLEASPGNRSCAIRNRSPMTDTRQQDRFRRALVQVRLHCGNPELAAVLHSLEDGSPRLFVDETTMPVLDAGRGKMKKGFGWAFARDDRPWGGSDPPAVVFHYAPGRGAEHAKKFLASYAGILQCDGYGAYKALAASNAAITLAFCWSHVHREFIELAKGKTAPIATETLQRIAALYAIEAEIRGKAPEVRRAVRQERSRSLVDDLFAWLTERLARLPSGSPTAQAIRYALNHREGLVRFLEDGRIELDNNTVERAIRPVCLSRKNALFASGDDGGARWAAVASLVETCKLNGVDPQRYFTDLLTRLVNGWPNSRINELMPWRWKANKAG